MIGRALLGVGLLVFATADRQGPAAVDDAGCPSDPPSLAFLTELGRERQRLATGPLEGVEALCSVARSRARKRLANQFALPTFADLAQIGLGLKSAGYRAFRWDEAAFRAPEQGKELWRVWARLEPETIDRLRRGPYLHVGFASLPTGEGDFVHVVLVAFPENVETLERLAPLADLDRVRSELHQATNAARRAASLPAVARSARLDAAAQAYAAAMRSTGFYGHEDPSGGTPRSRVVALGYDPSVVAENLARGPFSPAEVIERWLDSTGHRANLLSPLVTEVGFGRALDPTGESDQVVWVQVLAQEARE